jgi:hypothetical protein
MSAQQKLAWFNLSIAVATAITYLALWPVLGPWRAMGAFGLLGLAGFGFLFYYGGKNEGQILADERDQLINIKAYAFAKSVVWIALIVGFLLALNSYGENGAVPIQVLALVAWLAFCGFLLVQSLATLILYARQ